MKREDVIALLFVELAGSQLDGERLAHLPLDKQLTAIANMAVCAFERVADATGRHREMTATLRQDVMRDWRLDQ